MAEQEEKGPLEKPIDWFSGWKASFERIRQRFGMPVAVLLALSVAGGLVWWNWDDIAKRPGVEAIFARLNQRAVPTAPAGRLTIAVADLQDDEGRKQEKLLRDELGQFEGVELQFVGRAIEWPVANSESEAKRIAEEKARALLKKTGADVLIWGSVISSSGKSAMRLYWTPARDVTGAKSTSRYQPLTETIALPPEFWNDLKQILGLLSQSRLAEFTDQSENFVANKLKPLIEQVRALVQSREGVWNPETLAGVRFALATALWDFGEQSGTNEPLDESIELYQKVLDQWTRARVPLQWAQTQNRLGNALARRGVQEETREKGIPLLQAAVAAYGEALQEYTREGAPRDWAGTQMNLGIALDMFGERERDRAKLEEAAKAYRDALQELSREDEPFTWASAQMDLGNALETLGELETGTERLDEARAAYGETLKVYNREREPLDWARAQFNLGSALRALGEREKSTARLKEAVAAYREALKERTRERNARAWAITQNNLAKTLRRLGGLETGTVALEEAVTAYRESLKEWTRERSPPDWAITQMNLGDALETLGKRESGTARLEEAVAAYREALQENTRARVPLDWAMTQNNLGTALQTLGERESGTAGLEEAVIAYREALQERTRERVPLNWAFTQMNLALVYRALFDRDHQPGHLDDALEAADGALEEFRKANAAFYIDKAERQRGEILAAKRKLNHAGTRPKRLGRDH
jgi:tetratricopeptide (TPR) repeat protein